MNNYVISLENAIDRRKHIELEFKNMGVPFNFFNAINKENLDEYALKYQINFDEKYFSPSEKACFLSHVALWDFCIKENLEYIAIFEDDILLSVDSHHYLNDLDWIPSGIDIIKIEKFQDKASMSLKKFKIDDKYILRLLQQYHMGTAGYILSLKGAKLLINKVIDTTQVRTIDQLIFNEYVYDVKIDIYQLLPALVMQVNKVDSNRLPSQLSDERVVRLRTKVKLKKSISFKIKKEFLRLVLRIKRIAYGKIKINLPIE